LVSSGSNSGSTRSSTTSSSTSSSSSNITVPGAPPPAAAAARSRTLLTRRSKLISPPASWMKPVRMFTAARSSSVSGFRPLSDAPVVHTPAPSRSTGAAPRAPSCGPPHAVRMEAPKCAELPPVEGFAAGTAVPQAFGIAVVVTATAPLLSCSFEAASPAAAVSFSLCRCGVVLWYPLLLNQLRRCC